MADPSRLDASDWFNAGLALLMAGIGGLVKLFYSSKKAIMADIAATNTRLEEHLKEDALRNEVHSVALGKLETNQRNLELRVVDVKEEIQRSAHAGAQVVGRQFDQVMQAIRESKH